MQQIISLLLHLPNKIIFIEWGPSSFSGTSSSSTAKESRRAGGAEEAVYYTALELAALGYIVVIYAEVNDLDDGVIQYPSNYNNGKLFSSRLHIKVYKLLICLSTFILFIFFDCCFVNSFTCIFYLNRKYQIWESDLETLY